MKKLFDKKMIVLLIIAVISLIGHVCIYPMLPERIPIQWSSDGSVSNWGAKYMDFTVYEGSALYRSTPGELPQTPACL